MLDVNLRAPIVAGPRPGPGHGGRRRGHMVFVSSLSGKAAVAGIVDVLGDQVRAARVRARAAGGSARHGVGVSVDLPRLHP